MVRHGATASNETMESVALLVQDSENKSNVAHVQATDVAQPTKILFLDGVRGLAAILVVTQHSHEYMQDVNLGACAVDSFFVLSSFLLTMLFMKKSMKLLAQGTNYRKWAFTLADYFSKRFFRVYPLFTLVSLLLWMLPDDEKSLYYRMEQPENFDLYKVLTFDFDHRYFVLWTLPLEITYYFFIPVFVLVILKLQKLWWVSFIPAYGWVVYEGWNGIRWNGMGLLPHAPTFLAGSLAAVIFVKLDAWMKNNNLELQPKTLHAIRAVEMVALVLILSLSFQGLFFIWVHANIAPQTPGFPFISVLLTVVLVIEMILPSALSGVLEWSALRYFGKVSFSIYLLHAFVIYNDAITDQPGYYDRFFSRFGLTLLLATVSYHIVEFPSQLLAQYISRELNHREAHRSTGMMNFVVCKTRPRQTTKKAAWSV
ncbi:putative membrane protein [Phytophthora megakarya]|uniref:Putative membrane protein n=1 Tax=Phytophthora megakarya TaxID=4795 RepID=A0A225VB25_9STRA|nr:putative membrane protein [Phytophthora megakarya]